MRSKKALFQVTLILVPAITLLVVVIFSKNWTQKILVASGFSKQCKPTHHASGFVRKTLTLAELSAVSRWSKEVTIYGDDYNFWNNAEKKLKRCLTIKGTRYISCQVWAAPCRNKYRPLPKVQVAKKHQEDFRNKLLREIR